MAAEAITDAPPPETAPPAPAGRTPAQDAPTAEAKAVKPKKDAKGKGKGAKKDAKGAPATDPGTPSLAGHPRAVRAVAKTKSWGGLLGFLFGGYQALPTGGVAVAGLHALIAGAVCYVACWAGAVFVWRRLVILELKTREQELQAAVYAKVMPELGSGPSGGGERQRARP